MPQGSALRTSFRLRDAFQVLGTLIAHARQAVVLADVEFFGAGFGREDFNGAIGITQLFPRVFGGFEFGDELVGLSFIGAELGVHALLQVVEILIQQFDCRVAAVDRAFQSLLIFVHAVARSGVRVGGGVCACRE